MDVRRIRFVWAVRHRGSSPHYHLHGHGSQSRHIESMNYVCQVIDKILSTIPSSLSISIDYYITCSPGDTESHLDATFSSITPTVSNSSPSDFARKSDEKVSDESTDTVTQTSTKNQAGCASTTTRFGRPSVQKVIEDEVDIAEGPVSVDIAGPSGLSAGVRHALSSAVAEPVATFQGRPMITLHVETFSM
jgi:ferric-chelate reductase